MTDDDLTASRAACIPDVPKILAAADELADYVEYVLDNMVAKTDTDALRLKILTDRFNAYRSLRP